MTFSFTKYVEIEDTSLRSSMGTMICAWSTSWLYIGAPVVSRLIDNKDLPTHSCKRSFRTYADDNKMFFFLVHVIVLMNWIQIAEVLFY